MDRNIFSLPLVLILPRVALRKESVDRNCDLEPIKNPEAVALRKESVDRNILRGQLPAPEPPSLSARRAWIEILQLPLQTFQKAVALRKESVDRNIMYLLTASGFFSRSPQGERG